MRVALAEHATRPLLVFAHDDVVHEGKRLPDCAWDRGVDVREERHLERQFLAVVEALDPPRGAVKEVEEEALGWGGVVVRQLAPVHARHPAVASERRTSAARASDGRPRMRPGS